MRRSIIALSVAVLALAGIGTAHAQGDIQTSGIQVADIRIDFPVYHPSDWRDDFFINRPEPRSGGSTFEWPRTR